MSALNNYWKNISVSVANTYTDTGMAMFNSLSGTNIDAIASYFQRREKGPIKYKSASGYYMNSILLHIARQKAMQLAGNIADRALNSFAEYKDKLAYNQALEVQKATQKTLIKNQVSQTINNGQLTIPDSNGDYKTIIAKDKYGAAVPEALILYYKTEDYITVQDYEYSTKNETYSLETPKGTKTKTILESKLRNLPAFQTKYLFIMDLVPKINAQSSKNLVITQVQGRDYSRKELVSGGDVNFSVSGSLVSNEAGVYPSNEVAKFVQMMQYGGIINVNNLFFDQFNVTAILIKDWSLGEQEYKNIQPYQLNCVAIEPDNEIKVTKDTVGIVNEVIAKSPISKWYDAILDTKYSTLKTVNNDANPIKISNITSNI